MGPHDHMHKLYYGRGGAIHGAITILMKISTLVGLFMEDAYGMVIYRSIFHYACLFIDSIELSQSTSLA